MRLSPGGQEHGALHVLSGWSEKLRGASNLELFKEEQDEESANRMKVLILASEEPVTIVALSSSPSFDRTLMPGEG